MLCGGEEGAKAIREALVKLPEMVGVIPTVIEQKRIQRHATLVGQFFAIALNDGQRFGLRIPSEIADVVPRVVVQKRSKWMRAFGFNIGLKAAPR